ncbi:hypothetical protein SAMN04488057_118100 [Cyclobacterium lianum]|uniref:Uncharacterized protein n=1 Tax=Cyclobacterium lianum TaxID=388280 RepID=A0A1M7QIS7_9BACT|nr:hypothetical protein SAMN04488057_118100 [Cyclobacterium lianum]
MLFQGMGYFLLKMNVIGLISVLPDSWRQYGYSTSIALAKFC